MAEWSDAQIRTLIDERKIRNDEFHNFRRNWKIFWNSIADKINQENGILFNSHQCKEKFSNLVQNYNAICDFMSGHKSSGSQLGVQYFDEFRTHFWERPLPKNHQYNNYIKVLPHTTVIVSLISVFFLYCAIIP
ncbi:unnamed protein product [Rhizophagus irregularis]|uniref:Myb/SANT-like DNA-binding domain-containing protein n=1 Tax=Rhizophagus irregularis TaxID=588596 RepID=A0A2N1M2P8_9GLOM|nr:hypothetical protein RhiirC2_722187 [Rhizophagus irregularis]CAB4392610.1 unnamed protein product [Rhizophagus irregularis]